MNKKIKVLHIITRLIIGGAQENTLYTAELLNDKNFQVDILSGQQTGPEGSLIDEAYKKGIPLIFEKYLVREIYPIKDIITFFRLIKLIRRNQYTIVHTHSSKAGILGRWAAWIAGCPIIIHTVHGWGFHDFQNYWLRLLYIIAERITLLVTDQLIAVSKKDMLKGQSVKIGNFDNYTLIRSGIDLNEYEIPKKNRNTIHAELKIPKKSKVIGTVTRLSPQKSPMTFLEIAGKVLNIKPNIHFVMVGDGPMRKQIEFRIRELGIESNITLAGLRRDIPDLMHSFDIFFLTSLWEGLPRVIPQAMAAGIPVVATKVDGNAEIIQHQKNGIILEPNKIDEMVQALVNLIEDDIKANLLTKNAKRCVNEYCVHKMVDKIELLYTEKLSCLSKL